MIPDEGTTSGLDLATALKKVGVPTTVKGKVQRAIFRLIAGGMGFEYFEKVREKLDTVEGRTRVNMLVAEEVAKQAILDPEFMERAKARFLGDLASKQENVEAVARLAQQQSEADPEADVDVGESPPEPSQDWMNTFSRAAEDASSDELRERLATILAGEAKRPGTFSRSTVRLVAEMDKETLEAFQSILPHRAGDAIFTGQDWKSGDAFTKGVALENIGLLSGSTGFTNRQLRVNDEGKGWLLGDQWVLVAEGTAGTEKQIPIWLLSKTGREIVSLLPATDERAALREVAQRLDKNGLEKIHLGIKVPKGPGNFYVPYLETPWTKPDPATESSS